MVVEACAVETGDEEACMNTGKACVELNGDGEPWQVRWWLLAALLEAMIAAGDT